MSLQEAAVRLADDARERASGIAVAVIEGDEQAIHLDAGAGPLNTSTRFDTGSVTKTFTALLLAQMVESGELALDTPIGDIVDAGDNGTITLVQLATHTSGLARIPGNLMAKAMETPEDPYSDYTADDLLEAVGTDPVGERSVAYSNYGYMLLGHVHTVAGAAPYTELLTARVLAPLELTETAVSFDGVKDRVPGYAGSQPVSDWTEHVYGAGGVVASINDMAAYLRAQLSPSRTDLTAAIELTQRPHGSAEVPLAWQREAGALWHNGGTGGFGSMIAFDRAQGRAVAMLTNREHTPTIDRLALRELHETHP